MHWTEFSLLKERSQNVQNKVQIQEILVTRAEGPSAECVRKSFGTFGRANKHLLSICQSVLTGSHKVDFVAVFKDGETYKGRFDARNPKEEASEAPDIGMHMRHHLEYAAGLRKPSYWSDERYAEFLAKQLKENPTSEANSLMFLQKYVLRDEEETKPADVPATNLSDKPEPLSVSARLEALLREDKPMSITELQVYIQHVTKTCLESEQTESTIATLATLKMCGEALYFTEKEEMAEGKENVGTRPRFLLKTLSLLFSALTAGLK